MPEIFGRLTALGEPVRARVLLLLEHRELTVSELCEAMDLPQSTVSRHLKALADGGWLGSRREGTSRWYGLAEEQLDEGMRGLWALVRDEVAATAEARRDAGRLPSVLALRRERSKAFFATEAGAWDGVRDDLFGGGFFLHALPAFLDPSWVVGDLGCGTGRVAEALAPFVGRVLAVDASEEMLAAAKARIGEHGAVEFRRGEVESLPLADASLDAATLVLVLHHLAEPERALAEAGRVLKPGGRLLIVDMQPHDRQDLVERFGHVRLGVPRVALDRWLRDAGFHEFRHVALPADPKAKGPALFAAAASRGSKV